MKQVAYPWIIVGAFLVALPISAAQEIQPRMKFKAHSGSARTVLITSDDKSLITRGESYLGNDGKLVSDNEVKVWDFATGKQRALPKLAGQCIALSPDNKTLALADDRRVQLVDLITGNEVTAFKDNESSVVRMAFSPDGKILAMGWNKDGITPLSMVGVAQLRELATGKPIATLEPNNGPMQALEFSPDGKLLAVATQTFPSIGDVRFWNVSTGKVHSTLEAGGVDCISFSPDGKTLAAGCGGRLDRTKKDLPHHVRLWNVESATSLHSCRHEFRVRCLDYSPDGRTVAAGSELGELALWDTGTGEIDRYVPDQPPYVLCVHFTRDGKTLVSTNREGEVCYWDVARLPRRNADK